MANLYGDDNANSLFGANAELNTIFGYGGNDIIVGGALTDKIDGGTGNDSIYASEGDDYIYDNNGNNIIDSGTGDDRVIVSYVGLGLSGTNQIDLGQGDDRAILGGQRDHVVGGQGTDQISYDLATSGVTVNLQTGMGSGGWAEGDTYRSIEDIIGSFYADTLIGNGAYNTIYGGYGNDVIAGGAGGDELDGGEGSDALSYATSNEGVTVNLLTGEASGGHAEGDSFFNFENLIGSDFDDILTGDASANSLTGNGGADRLFGGGGADKIAGGAGADLILGQAGGDILGGGTGADRFIYASTSDSGLIASARDRILDFSVSEGDRIDLSRIDADTAATGNQAFTFIGASAFSGVSGELRAVTSGGNTLIYGDVNGDMVADFSIQLTGTPALTSAQFVL